jgi:hypothetical protein
VDRIVVGARVTAHRRILVIDRVVLGPAAGDRV